MTKINHLSHSIPLADYVQLRNGVPLGHPQSMQNMLIRSFGAKSFAAFWQYWNPIWGFALGRYAYAPLQRFLPAGLSVMLTFAVSGAIHDLATMLVRRDVAFLFTPWFFLLGLGAVASQAFGMNLSQRSWLLRAGANTLYLISCLGLTLAAKQTGLIP